MPTISGTTTSSRWGRVDMAKVVVVVVVLLPLVELEVVVGGL